MTFVPDTDTNSLAYVSARSLIKGEDLPTWDLVFAQWFLNACTAGTTLVTNSGTTLVPNGSISTAIKAANLAVLANTRNF